MRRLLRFSVNHPLITICGVLSISLVGAWFIPRVRLQLDARSLVPAGHPDLAASDLAASRFNVRDLVCIGVRSHNSVVYVPETLARIDRLSKALARIEGIVPSSVSSITTGQRLFVRDSQIDLRPLTNPEGDPGRVADIRRDIEALGLNDGVLVSADDRMALIVAEVEPTADRYGLLQSIASLRNQESSGADSIYLSGTVLAQATLGNASARDLGYLVPLVIVILAVALTLAFRHPAPALITLTEVAVSLLWTVSLMGLTGRSIFVTTLVMPVILISVGVSDDVYVLKHYVAEHPQGNPEAVRKSFEALIWPVGITTVSTTVGLLSFAATNLEPLIVFGIFGAVAIVISTLFTFSLVPAMLVLLNPRFRRRENPPKASGDRWFSKFYRSLEAGPYRILAAAIVLAGSALVLSSRVRVDDSWIRNLPPSSEVAKGDKGINELLAGSTILELMVDSNDTLGFLEPSALIQLMLLENKLTDLPHVGATYGIHHEVLRLNASLRGMSYSAYRGALLRGESQISAAEIEQALALITLTQRAPLTTRIDQSYHQARVSVFIRSADYERIDNILKSIPGSSNSSLSATGAITPFGDAWISYTTVRLLVAGQARSIALALIADLILLSLLFKSVRLALLSIIPVSFGVLVVFATLAVTGMSLGIANSMFVGISLGIGLDFAIHLTAAYQREVARGSSRREGIKSALVKTGPAIVTSAGAIAVGFSVLGLSQIMPNAQLGLMICLSLIVCATATLTLVPALVLAGSPGNDEPLPVNEGKVHR